VLARVWGCRGSLATPGRETLRYGGNTSCLEVRAADGAVLVFDAGTGITRLGLELADERPSAVHVLLTHLHFDHLEGLGFFAPLRAAGTDVTIWGPASSVRGLRDRISRYLSPPLFPLEISDFSARISFCDLPEEDWEIGGFRVRARHVVHLGPTVGYRVECDGCALAYIPDHEPALGVDLVPEHADWISGFEVAQGVDVLLHDAQFTEEEYPARMGWGHSSVRTAVEFAHVAGARRLVLFHHDPFHTDGDLEAIQERARQLWSNGAPPPELAYEGMELALE
jgi:phosphoribosyl 1,2-cyclic phosphodiesterase